MIGHRAALLLFLAVCRVSAATPESEALVEKGTSAFKQGRRDQAIDLFTQAARVDPSNHVAFWNRGRVRENEGLFAEAIPDFNTVVSLVTNHSGAFQLRGASWLRLGEPAKALADFDRYIELSPAQARHHWQRGIALYLLGRYEEGAKQYASCHVVNTNDVENALWHFACTARLKGAPAAKLLPVGNDSRPAMKDLYALYAGTINTNTLFERGKLSERDYQLRLTPAHFYVGLYYEVTGKAELARKHIGEAAVHAQTRDFIGAVAKAWPKRQE